MKADEAMHDLLRARTAAQEVQKQLRQQLQSFLLRPAPFRREVRFYWAQRKLLPSM